MIFSLINAGIRTLFGIMCLNKEIIALLSTSTAVVVNPIPSPLMAEVVTASVGHIPSVSTKVGFSFTSLVLSNAIISLLRHIIPNRVRIPAFIVIVASFVTMIQLLLEGFIPSLNAALGLYIPLIVVNCIILGRASVGHIPSVSTKVGFSFTSPLKNTSMEPCFASLFLTKS